MTEHEDYMALHNAVVDIYWDAFRGDVTREQIVFRLKSAIEHSTGVTFEECERLSQG
jgi:hypothetical protein